MKNLLLFLGLAFSQALSAQAPPPNDLCADAILIPIADKRGDLDFVNFSTWDATNSGNLVQNVPIRDVWVKFTTSSYIPARLGFEYRFPGHPYTLSITSYDNCNGVVLTQRAYRPQPQGVDSIPRRLLRPNTTYYLSIGIVDFATSTTWQDTFSIRIFGEEDYIPEPFTFVSIGSSATCVAKAKNKTTAPITISSISSSNPLFVPTQSTGVMVPTDGTFNVSVTYTPNDLIDDVTTVTVNTNRGDILIKVNGYPFGSGLAYEPITAPNQSYIFYPPGGSFNSNGSQYSPNRYFSNTPDWSIFSAYQYDPANPANKNLIVLPAMRPRPGVDKVSFFIAPTNFGLGNHYYTKENFEAYLSLTDSDSSSFNIQLSSDSTTQFGYKFYSVDLSAYHNRTVYLALAHRNSYVFSRSNLFLDDIRYPDNTTGIEGAADTRGQVATLYPNPSSGKFTISLPSAIVPENTKAKVMNIKGQVIVEYPFQSSPTLNLDLSHLPSGMYHIEVSTPTAAQTLKWVKVE